MATEADTGERHLRHNMSVDSIYKGKLIKDLKKKSKEPEEEIQPQIVMAFSSLFPGQCA